MSANVSETFQAMTTPGKVAVGVLVAAIAASCWALYQVADSLLAPSLDSISMPEVTEEEQNRFVNRIEADRSFIDQASRFFKPKRPTPPPPIDDDEPTGPPPDPPEPDRYGGPKLVGVAGTTAYFDSPVLNGEYEVKVGETGGTVEYVGIKPPAIIVLKWRGKNWDINLLESDLEFASSGGPEGGNLFGNPNQPARPFGNGGGFPTGESNGFLEQSEEAGADENIFGSPTSASPSSPGSPRRRR